MVQLKQIHTKYYWASHLNFKILTKMSNKSIIFFVLILIISSSKAQNKNIEIGFYGGVGISNNWGHSYTIKPPNKLITPRLGASISIGINKYFELNGNIAYETKGEKFLEVSGLTDIAGNELASPGDISYKFNYVTSCVLARALIGISSNIKVFVNGGPYIGYMINATYISKVNNPAMINGGYFNGANTDITNNYKNLDYGITGGVGILYPLLENLKITFEIRRNIGLNNISELLLINNGIIKNNSIDIISGLRFNL